MKSEIRNSFGSWYEDIDKEKYYTVLTDDIDSYLSCFFLKKRFGVEIGGFYDFKALYVNKELTEGKEPIYVDADVTKGYAFGNHVTGLRNRDCVNLNSGIRINNYTDKYAGSTLLMLYSLYDVDLRERPKCKVQLLLTIDVWFKQYFSSFRNKWNYWVEAMGMEYLTDIISEFSKEYYYDVLIDYKLNAKIEIKPDGTLFFPLDYEGIKEDFGVTIPRNNLVFDTKVLDLSIGRGDLYGMYQKKDRIFSNAMTFKDKLCYSFI